MHNHPLAENEMALDRWDRLGLFLSSLCAIHCLLTPLLVLSLPLVSESFENPWVHIVMAFFVLPVGLYAFVSGYRRHGQKRVLVFGLLGLFLIAGAAFWPVLFFAGGLAKEGRFFWEEGVTIIGSFFLLSAHLINRRACC